MGIQGPAGITAVGVRVDHRYLLIFRVHRIGKANVKVKLMLFHDFTSPVIVSLQWHSPCGMI